MCLTRKKLLFGLLGVFLAGCGGSGSSSTATDASVRFMNASPDSTAIDLSMNGMVGGANLAYLASTPAFTKYTPGSYDVSAQEASGSESLWDEVDTFSASDTYVVLAIGLENFGSEPLKRLQTLTLPVNDTVVNGNQSRLIVVNAFSRAPGFDTPAIDFESPPNSQFPLINIGFGQSQTELVNAGPIAFEALRTGTMQVFAQDSTPTTFVAGKTYLVLVTGIENGAGAQAPQIVYIPL